MAIITIVGSGMMGSAIGIPASENGHEVRLVGTPLDREIIEHARKTGWHLNMRRQLPESYKYYQFEELSRRWRARTPWSAAFPASAWTGSWRRCCPYCPKSCPFWP